MKLNLMPISIAMKLKYNKIKYIEQRAVKTQQLNN